MAKKYHESQGKVSPFDGKSLTLGECGGIKKKQFFPISPPEMGLFDTLGAAFALPAFIIGILAGWGATFLSRAIAFRFSILAKPSSRRRHRSPTPLLGGGGIYVVFSIGLLLLWALGETVMKKSSFSHSYVLWLLAAVTTIFITGLLDDWVELKPWQKLAGEVTAACFVLIAEDRLPTLFMDYGLPDWLGYGLALLWIVGATNAMNLVDGVDGLCSGIAVIISVGIFMMLPPVSVGSLASAVLAGAGIGFLIHNLHPATIFLGDSGSLLLGFTLSSLSLKIPFKGPVFFAMGVPLLLFGVPVLDTALAVYRRVRQSRSIFSGDRSHLHHRLLNLGLTPRGVLFVLLGVQSYLVLGSVSLSRGLGFAWALGEFSWYWGTIALCLPVVFFFIKGLRFTEKLISWQSARLSYLFLKEEMDRLVQEARMRVFLIEQIADYEANGNQFSIVVLDFSKYLNQIASERPMQLVNYFITLYSLLKRRVRETDLIAMPSELTMVLILAGVAEPYGQDSPVIEYLQTQIKSTQENFGIFQSDAKIPEGFQVLTYPADAHRIFRALALAENFREKANVKKQVA